MELVYMGKAMFVKDPATNKLVKQDISSENDVAKEYRQFMVRRKKDLEIIYTNGVVYWTEKIQKSKVFSPFFIQDIMVSQDN